MGNHLRVVTVGMAVLVSAASATAPGKHSVQKARTIDATYDATWTALIEVFAEHNWAIANMEKDSGLIATDWMAIPNDSPFADCGGSGIARELGTQIRFNVFVRDLDGDAQVTVNTSFRQLRSFDGKQAIVDCTSKGEVERQIHQELAVRAPRTKPRTVASDATPAVSTTAAPGPRFHCTAAPLDATRAACARSAAGCAKRQADLVEAVGDATPCVEAVTAVCFTGTTADGNVTESCHPTADACAQHHVKAAADSARFAVVTACEDAR